MRIQHIGYRIKGFYQVARLGSLGDMIPQEAHERLKVLQFFEKHRLPATQDAFGVSRRTLYRWKAALKAARGNPAALAAKSSSPKRRRTPNWPAALVAEIRRLRIVHPNLGKQRLQVLLAPHCEQHRIALPSASTIGRIIAKAPDKMRHAPARLDARGRPKAIKRIFKRRKPKDLAGKPFELIACDTIERIKDGLHRYIVTFLDPKSRFAFALATSTKNSRKTAAALHSLHHLLPISPRFMLSDNGSESLGAFENTLKAQGITHFFTYPKSPRMNALVERFNRTIQESLVDYHEDLLFTDLDAFNQKLADWLVTYNTVLPHHSLDLQSPLCYLLHHQPECQRWWTNTQVLTSPSS